MKLNKVMLSEQDIRELIQKYVSLLRELIMCAKKDTSP